MMYRLTILALVALFFGAERASVASAPANPLLQPSTLPFGAAMFDRIKDSDYLPAFDAAMAQHLREIQAIANNPAKPTFQNTFVAMERSGQLLNRVRNVFSAVSRADSNPTLQHVQEVEAPKLAAHSDAIYLNPKLFARVKSVHDRLNSLQVDPESAQLVRVYYTDFVQAGAQLSAADRSKLRTINQKLSVLATTFTRKLLAGTKAGALVLDNASQLAGLSDVQIAAAAQAATARGLSGKWLLPLQATTQSGQVPLRYLHDPRVRQQLFEHSWTRSERADANDTRSTIASIAQLRSQKAHLFGYATYAAYSLTDTMAKSTATVQRFLTGLIPAARAKVAADAAELQAAMTAEGRHATLQPWDWQYYAERVRKTKYNLDDNAIPPYFEINSVLTNGLFYAATQLYGITFKERKDIPVYHPDVRVFEVYDEDGSALALMYFDFFRRDNKEGGAWMGAFVEESALLGTKAVVYNVQNFIKGGPGQPTLLTADNVTQMFHEFGHALHAMFAKGKYAAISGARTSRDFVEYPSQFNEHWATYPPILKHYAFHFKTGEPIPQTLIDKMNAASGFNKGYALAEVLAADELDMAWHTLPPGSPKQDVDHFETRALASSHTDFPDVAPRFRSSYFAHIWSNGYEAAFYGYMWSEMLDDDTYEWFIQHGGLTRANGQRFRDMILSRGHSEDLSALFRGFYGRDPDVGPLLKARGLPPTP
ncbi:MAG: M3 family metallopeptidase [Candidatus Baltobacteraceae bacterium]